jgi:glycosyltransferase involved in cell wall biosynthesis
LIDIARVRDPRADDVFLKIRGPASRALESWLDEHAAEYDVVLAQGVPFSIPAVAVPAARRAAVPVVLLPHFHVEDRYYHWNVFYRAMQAATVTVLFPAALGELLARPLQAKAAHLSGGGVDPAEYRDLDDARVSFQAKFRTTLPYFVVLGRKTGSKGYQRAVMAVGQLNRGEPQAELIVIGPDADGCPIDAPHVRYLGPVDRRQVLGALAGSVGLISMSDSESFGIVIVEAWMCAKPVIAASYNAAFRELVEHDLTGMLVASEDELRDAMQAMLDDPRRAAHMGEAGRSEALRKYTWDAVAKRWADLLWPLTEERREVAAPRSDVAVPERLEAAIGARRDR